VETPKFLELAGADAEGVLASNPGLPLAAMPGGSEFKAKFEAKYGEIQNYAPYAYDAMNVLVDAMKRANSSDPAKYLAELPKTDYQGVTGRIRFDAKGDITGGAVTLYQVKDGKWQTLETVQSGK
jgi:branched-chain amino acid transport system substrate-binding protein